MRLPSRPFHWLGLLLVPGLLGLGAFPARAEPPEAVLDALFGNERRTVALQALAERESLGPDEGFRVVEVARDTHTSHHLVWIRDREVPHRHDRHDLVVVMLRGHGTMWLGDEERVVGEGSILYVPRGTPHAFRNASGEPAAAYAVYVPPFDPEDRQPVD
jgi:mannose-6-phosphate isomerase-like protein (cupin superfamily)